VPSCHELADRELLAEIEVVRRGRSRVYGRPSDRRDRRLAWAAEPLKVGRIRPRADLFPSGCGACTVDGRYGVDELAERAAFHEERADSGFFRFCLQ